MTPFEAYLLVLKNYVEHRTMDDHGARVDRIAERAGISPLIVAQTVDATLGGDARRIACGVVDPLRGLDFHRPRAGPVREQPERRPGVAPVGAQGSEQER